MHEVLQSPGGIGRWLGVLDDLLAPVELEEANPTTGGRLGCRKSSSTRERESGCEGGRGVNPIGALAVGRRR